MTPRQLQRQQYIARLISGYAEMTGLPSTSQDGRWWVQCGGYQVDMVFAGPFATQTDASQVADALQTLTANAIFAAFEVVP